MAVAFNENACFIATAISCEIMTALKSFNAIMATFYYRVSPAALMIVHDLLFPITHRLEGASNGGVVNLIALFTPTLKSQFGNAKIGRAVIPSSKRFFPFPHASKKRRVVQQHFQALSTLLTK